MTSVFACDCDLHDYNRRREVDSQVEIAKKRRKILAKKLSKEERKAMARKALEDRAKQPKKAPGSGFAKLDSDAKNLRGY